MRRSGMYIVKRRGHKEEFDEKKLYASVYYACKSVEIERKKCVGIAEKLLRKIKAKLKKKKIIDSHEIFRSVGRELEKQDEHAALMYKTHRDLS
ncbi:MAG: ATP cone domain-containing protein [Candidatus Norongarragalinales archaeon]